MEKSIQHKDDALLREVNELLEKLALKRLQNYLTISFTNSLDQRFLEVDRNIAQRFAEVDTRFTEVNTNINSLRSDLVAIMKNMQVSIKHIYDVTHLNLATNCENGVYEINTSFK